MRACTKTPERPGPKSRHVLHHPAPEQGRDAEQQRDPEPISEHRHAMPFMPVVSARLTVIGVTRRPRPTLGSVGHRVMVLVRGVFGEGEFIRGLRLNRVHELCSRATARP